MARRIAYVEDGVLHQPALAGDPGVAVGSPGWWRWLDDPATRSFAFRCAAGRFTARKERRQRGTTYWTAYRKLDGRVDSAYLGKSADLTLERLTIAAARLSEPDRSRLRRDDGTVPASRSPPAHPAVSPASPILTTKLFCPRPRTGLVLRQRLLQQLEAVRHRTLTLIAAPAGFGKTTLLAEWLALHRDEFDRDASTQHSARKTQNFHVAWLSLDDGDNDPVLFLRALIAALQTALPTAGTNTLARLQVIGPHALDALLVTLLNELATLDQHLVLVLDDYHVITTPAIHDALTFLLDHRPPSLQFVIATREEPPLPLTRWRARGELAEMRAADLRFTPDEAAHFFREVMGLSLSADAVAALAAHTEGWIAGLQLAALAIQGHPDAADFIAAFTSSTRFIIDYLAEEVIGRLPVHLQTFLRQTAILERVCGALCDAVVLGAAGDAQAPYSLLLLDELERRQLFLIPLDVQRTWYRYHQLFRDVLCRQLLSGATGDAIATLHRRASDWFAQQGMATEAIQHALAAQDWERAILLLDKHGIVLEASGQIQTVLGWLNALPEAQMRELPLLSLIHAITLLLTNQFEAAAARLQAAERANHAGMPDEQVRRLRGHVAIVRAIICRAGGDLRGYVAWARQAVALLPQSELLYTTAVVAANHVFWISGDATPANERKVAAAIEPARKVGNLISVLLGLTDLAHLYVLQGRLRAAAAIYARAAQIVSEPDFLHNLFGSPAYYFGLGDLLREWNDLDGGERLLEQGMLLTKATMMVYADILLQGYVALARLKQARGDNTGAMQTLDDFMQLARQRDFAPPLIAHVTAAQARIALAQGDLQAATRWADASTLTLDDTVSFRDETAYLTLARLRIAQGRSDPTGAYLRDALRLLDRLHAAAEAGGRGGSLLEIDMLRALAFQAGGDHAAALAVARRMLARAANEGYVRLLLDEGAPMMAVLRAAHAAGIAPDYIETLLAAFPYSGSPDRSPVETPNSDLQDLSEPLTARELEVLRLLVAGHSTQEIAKELIVANGTVKRHISNILGKLGVHSRLQAVTRAHDLRLL